MSRSKPRRVSRYRLFLFQPEGYLHRTAVLDIQRLLAERIKTPKDRTEIDVILDSPGGDAHATFKLFLDLRSRARWLRAIIPDCAKSAATLLTIGMDEIYMAAGADLGPLDIQLPHPNRENLTVSGLDVVGSLNYVSEVALHIAVCGGASILEYTGLQRTDVLAATLHFAAELLRPCVEKIDPHVTHQAMHQLEVAEHYAVKMLSNRACSPQFSDTRARDIINHLVRHYPIHGFVISREEAKDLGFPVKHAETLPDWEALHAQHCHFLENNQSVVAVDPIPPTIEKEKRAFKPKRKRVRVAKSGANQSRKNGQEAA